MRTEEELNAALRLVAIQQAYAARGIGLAQAAMAGAVRLEPLQHCPRDDVVDAARGQSFYYHAHGARRRPDDEHGHFHLFEHRPDAGGFVHLAALSLDAQGWPLRWFATNRWVTGGRWAPAGELIAALDRFAPATRGRLAPVADWLAAMVTLYRGTLASMLRRRDRVIARRLAVRPAEAVFEDRRLDVVVESRIALPGRLARLSGMPAIH